MKGCDGGLEDSGWMDGVWLFWGGNCVALKGSQCLGFDLPSHEGSQCLGFDLLSLERLAVSGMRLV